MNTRSNEHWPYATPKSRRANAIAEWAEDDEASPGSVDWKRWGVIGLLAAAAAVTVLSSIAVAALRESDTQVNKQWSQVTMAAERIEADAHLQELLREHRDAVFGI